MEKMSETFDFASFHRAVVATVALRSVSWKTVSEETGVSQSTLSRMTTGRQPDAASLTAIASWSGLNPVDFYGSQPKPAEPMAMVGALLRKDPRLDGKGAEALEAIIMAAYERFRSSEPDGKTGG